MAKALPLQPIDPKDPFQLAIPGTEPPDLVTGVDVAVSADGTKLRTTQQIVVGPPSAWGPLALPPVTLTAEELADLREEYGVDVESEPGTEAARDAYVSGLFQALRDQVEELGDVNDAEQAEHDRVALVYGNRRAPVERRARELRALIAREAMRAQFKGKAKSRKTAFGKYGRKQVPTKVEIVDKTTLLEHAFQHERTIVRGEVALPLPSVDRMLVILAEATDAEIDGAAELAEAIRKTCKHEISKSALNKLYAETGEELPGTDVRPAHDEPVVEPFMDEDRQDA
jgi:hypothetical protein